MSTNGSGPHAEPTTAPMTPGMHVPAAFLPSTVNVTRSVGQDGTPMVIFHVEHMMGSTIIVWPADMAASIGKLLLRNATGIEVVKGLGQL